MSQKTEAAEAAGAEEQTPTLVANVTQGVPDMLVEVNEGNTIGHDGETYTAGDEVLLPGPTAISLVQGGHVTIKETP